ncbi:MAG: TlpA disulfide reductase family protein [Planctomycetales bacterium]
MDNPVAEVQADKPRVHQKNGDLLYGTPTGYDPVARTFQFKEDKKEISVPADRITNIHLPNSEKNSTKETKPDTKEASTEGEIRLVFRNGTRISGQLKEIKDGKVVLHGSGISGTIAAPLSQLQTLMTMQEKKETSVAEKTASLVFVGDGIRLRGELSPTAQGGEEASLLGWSPRSGNGAVPFRVTAAGRILSKEKGSALLSGSVAASTPVETGTRVVLPGGGIAVRRVQGMNTARPRPQQTYRPPSLYLRTGDTIPCRVTRIDEKGVSFESTVAKSKFIPHDKIKAVELVPRSSQVATYQPRTYGVTRGTSSAASDRPRLDETKRDRLLTLPRMQRNNPPTHLIVATNKDILRGRIVSLDENNLRVELRLDQREIPRDRIGQIIWLHSDELEGKTVATPAVDRKDQKPRVHAVGKDGNRFTFIAEKLEGEKLSGTNEVLGPCEANLGQLDELLLGSEIEQAATQLAYQQWKLHYAEEPLIADGGDSESSPNRTGLESPLVGKPAPSFSLELVKPGEKFSLGTNLGKVIILDFWASWCGPCMQTIPQVHAVAEEFRDQGVELIGVNLEEAPQQIRAALARLKLQMTVAMDKEGKVGGLYGVTSIPKTVIIDREGKVARVYVGGHGSFANELRDALKAVIDGKKSEPAPAKP